MVYNIDYRATGVVVGSNFLRRISRSIHSTAFSVPLFSVPFFFFFFISFVDPVFLFSYTFLSLLFSFLSPIEPRNAFENLLVECPCELPQNRTSYLFRSFSLCLLVFPYLSRLVESDGQCHVTLDKRRGSSRCLFTR